MTSFEKWERGGFCGFSLISKGGSAPIPFSMVASPSKFRDQKQWEPDDSSDECRACGKAFSLYHRRHHCRSCGRLICGRCLLHEKVDDIAVKVCHQCSRLYKDVVDRSLLDKLCSTESLKPIRGDDEEMKRSHVPTEIAFNMFETAAEGKSPAHTAVLMNDLAAISNFTRNRVDINATLLNDCTPLHLATALGRLAMVKRLLDNGADITKRTLDGSLPIHFFCAGVSSSKKSNASKQESIPTGRPVKKKNSALSLSKCSSPSNKFSVTSSPRRKEGEGKGTKGGGEGGGGLTERELLILEILKELGQQGCVHAETLYGESALHMACQGVADPFIVRQLLRFGLDPLGKADASIGGSSPHEIAISRNIPEQVIHSLQEAILFKLIRAVQLSDKATVMKCLDLPQFPSLNTMITKEDTTFLHLLCQKNPPPEMMEIIFNHKSVDVNVRDPFGWAPIHSMCKSSSIDLICLLADAGADLAATNLKNVSALHYLCGRSIDEKDREKVSRLMKKLIEAVEVNWASSSNETPLHYACQGKRDPFITKILLDHGASVLARTKRGFSPLELFSLSEASGQHPGTAVVSRSQTLLAGKLSQELFRGIRNNDAKLVKLAIDSGADVCSAGTKKILPLFVAISEDKKEVVETILASGLVDSFYSDNGLSVLHFAALHGSLSMILYLLETSLFNTASETNSGAVPLHFFCRRLFKKETNSRESPKKKMVHIMEQLLERVDIKLCQWEK